MRRLSIGLNAMVKHDRKNQDGPINRRELMLKSSLPVSRKNVFSEANDQDDAQQHESSLLRRKSIQEYFQDIHLDDGPQTPRTGSGGFIPMPHENMEWDRLENVEFLAQGGMCRVLSATLHGVPCVIKIGRDDHANPEVVKLSLKDEITVLRRLKHPNVVGYYGSGRGADGGLFLVLERLDHRALHHRLGTAPGAKKQTARGVPLLARLKWGLELATGMAYLHDRAVPGSMVLHRDLKPENLGFGADGRLKIMDMGLALIVDRHFRSRADRYKMSGQVGSARYMSPEVAQRQRYNEKADVHSFAVILWEMLALRLPFADMDLESFTREVVEGGMRPPLKKEWGDDLKDLMTQAWDPDPDARPSFREVAGHLECILAEEIERAPAPPRGGGGGGGGGGGEGGGGGGGLGRRLTERIRGRNGSSASASEPNSPRDSITNAYQKRASSTETAPSSRRGLSLKGLGAALSRTVSRRRRGRNSNSASEDSPGAGVEVGAVGGLGGRRAQPRSWSQADAMDAGGEGMFNPEGFLADSEEEDDNELDNSLGGKKILPDKRRAKRVSSLPESTGHGGGHGKKPEFRMPHIMRKLDTNSAQRFQSQQISNSIDSSYNSALQESAHSTSIPGIEETGITIPELDDEDEQEEMMMVTPPTRRTASMGEIKGHVSSSKKGPSLSRQPSGQENGPPARNKGPDPKTGSSMESNGRSPDHSSTPTPRTAVKASPRMVVKASPRRLKSPAAAYAGEGLPPPPLPGGDGPGAPPEVAAAPLLPLVAGAASPPPAPGDGEGGAPAEEAPGGGGGGRGVDTVEDGCRPRQQQQGAALALQARLRPPQERSVQKPRGAGTNSNRGEQDGGLGGRQISYRVDAPRTGEEC